MVAEVKRTPDKHLVSMNDSMIFYATYILTGHIDYTDPLGCKHHEYVNGMYTLSLSI